MLTLLPPTVVYLPLRYNEELHDTNRATWDEEEAKNNPKLSISHYRPVLLYGNHLHVAVKGLIGKKMESSKHAPSPSVVTKTQTLSTRAPPPPPPPPPPVPPPPSVTKTQNLSTRSPPAPPPSKPSISHRRVNDYRQSHGSHSTTEPADKPKGQRRSRSPPLNEPLSPNKKSKDEEIVENPPPLTYRSKEMGPSVQQLTAIEQNEHKLQQNSKTRAAPSQPVPDTHYPSQGPPPLVTYLPASQGHSSTQMKGKRTDSMSSTPVQTTGGSHQRQPTYSVSSSNPYHPLTSSRDIQDKMKREGGDITSRVPTQTTRQGYRPDAYKGVTPPTTSESVAGIIQRHKETKTINNPAGATSKYNEPRPPAKQKSAKPPPSPPAVTKEKITGGNLKIGTTATSSSHRLPPTGAGRPLSSNKTSKSSKGNGIHSQSSVPVSKQTSGYRRPIMPQRTPPPQKSAVFKETVYPKTPTSSSDRMKLKSRPVSGNRNTKENANTPAAVTISRQRTTTAGSRFNLDSNSRSKVSDRSSSYTPPAYQKKDSPMVPHTSSVKTPLKAVTSVKDHLKGHTTAPPPTLPNMPCKPVRGPVRSPVHEYSTVGGYGDIPLPQGDRPQSRSNSGSRAKRYKLSETPRSRPPKIDATFKPDNTIRNPTTIKRPTKEQSPTVVSPKPCQTSPISSIDVKIQEQQQVQHELRSGKKYGSSAVNRMECKQIGPGRGMDAVLRESRGNGALLIHVQRLKRGK